MLGLDCMSDIQDLTKRITEFRDARDWKQFHNAKDMALSLSLEASELLEHFQWRNGEEIVKYVETHKTEVSDELADVLYWVLLISHDLNIDIAEAVKEKIQKTEKKYPIDKAKGKYIKYDQL